jgi:hypothetical protein
VSNANSGRQLSGGELTAVYIIVAGIFLLSVNSVFYVMNGQPIALLLIAVVVGGGLIVGGSYYLFRKRITAL